jgi:uncharacterized protein (DUF1919 family)
MIDVLYNKYYPPTVINRMRLRKKNHNNSFTLLTANCMGGYIYHQLDVPFQSPTINLMMLQPDFYKLILNLPQYLSMNLADSGIRGGRCPVGKLGDLTVFFTHYADFEDGASAWEKRAQRVNYDNIFIIATDRDGVTEEDILKLSTVKCKKIICFTAKKYDYPYCFQVEEFKNDEQIGNILGKTLSGKWKFEKFFDFVGWLNNDDPVAEHFRL